jgi:hypothetical protein
MYIFLKNRIIVPRSEHADKSNRRASLPHNLKIPVIIFTPPSPSPDIDDPDYPEFFEAKPYIESKNGFMSTSIDGDDLKMATDASASSSLESRFRSQFLKRLN